MSSAALLESQVLSGGHVASSGLPHLLVVGKLEGHQLGLSMFILCSPLACYGPVWVLLMVASWSQCLESIGLCHTYQIPLIPNNETDALFQK